MNIDKIINILVTVTLIQMMVTIGLGVTVKQVGDVGRDWRLVLRALVVNYVVVPAIAVALILLFHAPALVAAGFLVAAVCPGAPYGPPFTGMAKGDVPMAVGLMVLLAASSAIFAPLVLHLALPITSGSAPLNVDVLKMVQTLLITQLVPLAVGIAIRLRKPDLADRFAAPAKRLSLVLNLAVFGLILVVQFHLLVGIKLVSFGGMFVLAAGSVLAGWLFGGPGEGGRVAMAFSSGVRNVGVSLVIATASFPGTPAITAALAYALFQTILLALLALGWGRIAPGAIAAQAG